MGQWELFIYLFACVRLMLEAKHLHLHLYLIYTLPPPPPKNNNKESALLWMNEWISVLFWISHW